MPPTERVPPRIDGVEVRPLAVFSDARGTLRHMLRANAPHFQSFGEIYFSGVNPGAVKAWHCHRTMTCNYAVPVGHVLLVLFDGRDHSPTAGAVLEIHVGEDAYALVTIPPGIWIGFTALGDAPALVANCATLPHDAAEMLRRPPDTDAIPYRWPS